MIRPATAADTEAALSVLRRSITELCVADHRNDPETLRQWLADKTPENFRNWLQSGYCVVAEHEGRVVGVGLLGRGGEIQLCYVSPEAQHTGCGHAILAALEKQARAWNLPEVQLASTAGARAFYEKHGFSPGGKVTGGFGVSCCHPYHKAIA